MCRLWADAQITRDYMAQGYDGYEGLKGRKFIIDDENGQIMSSIIRSFLLGELSSLLVCLQADTPGSSYIFRHSDLIEAHDDHLSKRTDQVLYRARARGSPSPSSSVSGSPQQPYSHLSPNYVGHGLDLQRHPSASEASAGWGLLRRHTVKHDRMSIRDALFIGRNEHMSGVDSCVSPSCERYDFLAD